VTPAHDLRLWIGVAALSCFGAGLAVDDYARLLAQRFALSQERRDLLEVVLEEYKADADEIRGRHMAELNTAMEPELRELGQRYRAIVRDKVLPVAERDAFDRLASGPR
jgi:hypothetical protein